MLRSLKWTRVGAISAVLMLGLFVNTAFAQGGAVVKVDPAASSVAPGQTVVVAIKVDSVANLAAFELHLQFDKDKLEVTQLANGGFVLADFTAQNTFDNTAGTIDYAVAQINRTPASGSGSLLAITFRGKAGGASPLGYRGIPAAPTGVILADANGSAIAAALTPGNVTVVLTITPGTPTATPTRGPTLTPTATPTHGPTPTATPTLSGSLPILGNHTVKYGESLFCIGRAYMVSPWAIAQVNDVAWPYTIFPNRVLKIPNSPWVNPPAGPVCQRQPGIPSPTVTPIPGCRAQYTVVYGDTLYRIALRFNSNVYTIAQANRIGNINLIYPGQALCIP
jgi:LysM repeat protein